MSKSSGVKTWAFLFGKKLSRYRYDTALTREEKQRTEKDSMHFCNLTLSGWVSL